jgi:hypothetical protein
MMHVLEVGVVREQGRVLAVHHDLDACGVTRRREGRLDAVAADFTVEDQVEGA